MPLDRLIGNSRPQRWGKAAVAGIALAVGSLAVTVFGEGIWSNIVALILGVLAVPLGLLGMLFSVSPRVRGGLVSIAAVVLGVIAAVVALIAIFIPG